MKQSFRALLVVMVQIQWGKLPSSFMSYTLKPINECTHSNAQPLIEPLGPDITGLASGTNRALPASDT